MKRELSTADGRNQVLGLIKQGRGLVSAVGLVFATCCYRELQLTRTETSAKTSARGRKTYTVIDKLLRLSVDRSVLKSLGPSQ